MTELRWILLLIGIAAFAGIYLHGLWRARSGRVMPRHEPNLNTTVARAAGGDTGKPRQGESKSVPASVPGLDKLVTLHVEAGAEGHFTGQKIFSSAQRVGLEFADDGLFHRRVETATEPLYSMTNMVNPGAFDPGSQQGLRTPGVSFFMRLPGPMLALEGFDAMLAAAQRVAELLAGEVRDEQHCTLSRQRILHLRDEMRSYDRQRRGTPSFSPR